ncbi:MAG: HNH endonuclease [Thermodesulfobacteriota bacterium]|jgi:5-methylcytosine-specific restriction protein A
MPWVFKVCKEHSCNNRFTDLKESYCLEHRRVRQQRYDRTERDPEIVKFYNSRAWKAARTMQFNLHPLCQLCLKVNIIREATTVDHIVPIDMGGEKLDQMNLQSVCASCHASKHAWGKG